MHTDRHFAETLVHFGQCALAVEVVAGIRNEKERLATLFNILKAMARFFGSASSSV